MGSKATTHVTGPRTKTCCHCGGSILWLATQGGRVIPVDATPSETGTIIIQPSTGKAVVLMADEVDDHRGLDPLYAYHDGTRCHRLKKRYTR